MKKFTKFCILLAMLLVLTGCECRHEWTEADCLTAKTCAKCGVAEGEAMGHDFAPAECEKPETCTRCGMTQGEMLGHQWVDAVCDAPQICENCGQTQGAALGHDMDKWTISGETMSRICGVCNFAEEQPIDREAYLRENLVGYWDYMCREVNEEMIYPEDFLDSVVEVWSVSLAEDGSAHYNENGTGYSAQWTFERYEEDRYFCTLTLENGESMEMTFLDREEDELWLPQENGNMVFSQYSRYAPYVPGSRATVQGDQLYCLTLNEDHTLTGQMDGEVTGTWNFQMIDYYGYTTIYIVTDIQKEEQLERVRWTWLGFDTEAGLEQWRLDGNNMTLYTSAAITLWGSEEQEMVKYLNYVTPEQMDQLRDAMSGDRQAILGTWDGISSTIWRDDRAECETAFEETILFQEDGTCTFFSNGEQKGTWMYQGISALNRTISYEYRLNFDGISRADARYYPETGRLLCEFVIGGEWVSYDFAQMTPEEKEICVKGPELLPGTWSCEVEGMQYTLTIQEDGSFQADMQTRVEGTWSFWNYNKTDGHMYYLQFSDQGAMNYLYSLGEDGTLWGSIRVEEEWIELEMTKE